MTQGQARARRPATGGLEHAACGIGLRAHHLQEIAAQKPPVGFLEVHSENYFHVGGIAFARLAALRRDYPISLHGVGLSLGSADGLDEAHLQKLQDLVNAIEPALVSEHMAWSRSDGLSVPDLLPLPLTPEALQTLCDNINRVQDRLGRTILIENPSSYMAVTAETSEPQFIAAAARRTGCGILLDINNIHVSATNLGFDARQYMDALPEKAVGEIHLAGFEDAKTHLIDAHNNPVAEEVWQLYRHALRRFGNCATLVEWDSALPPLSVLLAEAQKADVQRRDAGVWHDAA